MRPGTRKNFGKLLKPVSGLAIQNVDASTDAEGAAVDRSGYYGAVVVCKTGTSTGGASAQSHRFKVQHSDTNQAADFVDITENGPNDAPTYVDVDGDGEIGKINLNLEVAKKYLRVVYDSSESSFTGGSAPATDVSVDFILAYKDEGLEA